MEHIHTYQKVITAPHNYNGDLWILPTSVDTFEVQRCMAQTIMTILGESLSASEVRGIVSDTHILLTEECFRANWKFRLKQPTWPQFRAWLFTYYKETQKEASGYTSRGYETILQFLKSEQDLAVTGRWAWMLAADYQQSTPEVQVFGDFFEIIHTYVQ